MKTHVQLRQHFAEFLLGGQKFQTEVVKDMKTHTLCQIFFLRKYCLLGNIYKNTPLAVRPWIIEHYIAKNFRVACRVFKIKYTSSNLILIAFDSK
jgi:hypothetical protein